MLPKFPHRVCWALLALSLLIPWLAACGGGAPAAPTASRGFETVSGRMNDSAGMAAPTAAPAATASPGLAAAPAPAPTAAPAGEASGLVVQSIQPQQQLEPLRAGEVDDNLDFAAYQNYLAGYFEGGVAKVDVTERLIITVVNEQQQPVINANVAVFAGDTPVFEALTYAGGRTIMFPRALGLSDNQRDLRVMISKGQATATGQIVRGEGEEVTFVLGGVQAAPAALKLDVLFLLDATGSMGDEISNIQATIRDIAGRIDQFSPRPELRFGLVSYRDRGDAYVTNLDANFTSDVEAFRTALMQVRADGGGDNPEDLNSALVLATQQMSWSEDAVRLIFLVADAPAHMDYGQEFTYVNAIREATKRGLKFYPIAASNTDSVAEYQMRQLAQQTMGSFIFLTYQEGQSAGTPGDTTTMNVEPGQFTVDRLDDLVVLVIQRELRLAIGVQ
ncbi:MAG: hypothetical protein Fur005_29520 [Roseiflexaceae bacterium]